MLFIIFSPSSLSRRNFEAIRKGNFKLVVGMDDTYQLGWHARYATKLPPPWSETPTLPGAEIKCGPWTNGEGMCDSKDHHSCLFNLADGNLFIYCSVITTSALIALGQDVISSWYFLVFRSVWIQRRFTPLSTRGWGTEREAQLLPQHSITSRVSDDWPRSRSQTLQ